MFHAVKVAGSTVLMSVGWLMMDASTCHVWDKKMEGGARDTDNHVIKPRDFRLRQ